MRIDVIGVGSDRGDDAAGLRVAERLAASGLPAGARAIRCERPFPDLLDQLGEAPHAILVDALRAGEPPGSLVWLSREELARRGATSSHGLGVARVLDLAEALAGRSLSIEILGIGIGATGRGGEPLASTFETSIDQACTLVRQRLEQLLAAEADAARRRGAADA